jgi:hypothetical protein
MRRGPFLLDTGFLVALVNAADPDHAACAEVWRKISGPFITTEGVLVEAAHLLRRQRSGFATAWGLVRSVGTLIRASTTPRLDRAVTLMDTYADVPMDFVDATLVCLAEETGVLDVLTLDARGFGSYRVDGRRFTIRP